MFCVIGEVSRHLLSAFAVTELCPQVLHHIKIPLITLLDINLTNLTCIRFLFMMMSNDYDCFVL